jgi:2-iminobutanoate/2-iminopropanoate deaminase
MDDDINFISDTSILDIMRSIVNSDEAPEPIGPYSHAVICKGMVYCSGQIGIDPTTGRMVDGGVGAETRRSLENLQAVLRSAGSDMSKVLRCTVYVTDLGDFAEVNSVYSEFFPTAPPSRTTVQVAALPRGSSVEIDAIAERI